jgi:trigger factor
VKVSTERAPNSQVVLQIEVDDDRLAGAMESAYKRLAAKTRIPGFRPGKAPRAVVEAHLGEHALLHEAIDWLVPRVYREALDQEEIDPIDYPQVSVESEQPLIVKATVPVRPEVDLKDYRALRLPREEVTVDPEQVEESLEQLRRRYATLEPIERPVQWGDILRADIRAEADGASLVHQDDVEFRLEEGRVVSLPGVAEELLGVTKGAEKEFEVTIPDDISDEKLHGKQAKYHVTIKEIKQEVLPDLDGDFAAQVGEGFASVEALRTRLTDDLRQSLEDAAEHRFHDEILDALIERADLEYPEVLVDRETERMLREQSGAPAAAGSRSDGAAQDAEALARYLQQVGKTEEEVRAELRPLAQTRVRRSLVLSKVTEAEDIQVGERDVEEEIDRLVSGASSQQDELRRLFSSDNAKESLRRSLLTRRTLDRLAAIASGDGASSVALDGPPEPEAEAEPEPASAETTTS